MKREKQTNVFLSVLLGVLVVFSIFLCLTTKAVVFTQEQNKSNGGLTIEIDLREYAGYGCNNEIVLQEASRGNVINFELENISGFGCGSSCGASREEGYSLTYASGCKNWQVMPIISPIFKYWIDESTLSSLTETQKNEFINNVDNAAAEWNSVRIADYAGAIVR